MLGRQVEEMEICFGTSADETTRDQTGEKEKKEQWAKELSPCMHRQIHKVLPAL